MLEVVMYFVIIALVLLVVFYFYIEAKRKKIIAENKKAISLRITKMKDNFKTDLKKRVEQEILTVTEHGLVYQIANNFFVFQKVSPSSISYCEQLLKNVISAMPTLEADTNVEFLQQQISVFVSALPKAANGYNASFYRDELPKLINQLIDAQENQLIVEDEVSEDVVSVPASQNNYCVPNC